jgi:hypothetical protein
MALWLVKVLAMMGRCRRLYLVHCNLILRPFYMCSNQFGAGQAKVVGFVIEINSL